MNPVRPRDFRGVFRTDAVARAVYSECAGVARIVPTAIAVPDDADDVVTLVRWAAAQRVPLIARGSGSSMANGALGDGVIVDTSRLARLGRPRARSRTLIAGAAVTRDRLQRSADRLGLSFPVDPSSGAFATIGGMVATHAAGAGSVKHGPLRDWISGIECVFADGQRTWLRRAVKSLAVRDVPAVSALTRFLADVAPRAMAADPRTLRHDEVRKESSGYSLAAWRASGDLLDLIIGSEGTLAIITAVEVRLLPRPAATASLLAGFTELESAAAVAVRLAELGASAVELLDRSFLEIAASEGSPLPLPRGLEAVLIVESEGTDQPDAHDRVRGLADACMVGGASHLDVALTAEHAHELWQLRHAASPILSRLAPRFQSLQLVEDGCVPPSRFVEYVHGVRRALADARIFGVIFGHAGDAHAHVNAMVDVGDPDWRARCEQLVEQVTALVARLGGTLAGEHGDGRLRTPLLSRVWPTEAIALFSATKRAFDPEGILNPGVKVPAPGTPTRDAIKYDPALPPLPASARDALDRVTREQAWARHRLDLLPPHTG